MPSRDFDAARRERQRKLDPIEFILGGVTFTCLTVVPVGIGLDMAAMPEIDPTQTEPARAYSNAIKLCLPDDDSSSRFDEVIREKTDPIDPDTLRDVWEYIVGEYAGRPTQPSDGSSVGRQTTGRASNSKRSRKASAPSPT